MATHCVEASVPHMLQECLDRLALSLGGNTLMPLVARLLPGLMADLDWKQRHAALICLAQIAEGCVKAMLGHLDSLVGMCLQVRIRIRLPCQFDSLLAYQISGHQIVTFNRSRTTLFRVS